MSSLKDYLHFGYIPTDSSDASEFRRVLFEQVSKEETSGRAFLDFDEYVHEGARVFKRVLRRQIKAVAPGAGHILPLSGGLDSRAVLAALLENVNPRDVTTVTFGTPGTYDYEIGTFLARRAGVKTLAIDLESTDWRWDAADIRRLAATHEEPTWLFEAYVNHAIFRNFGDATYWSGFMGDPLAGSHLPAQESLTWEDAQSGFVRRNRFSRSVSLTPPDYDPKRSLPPEPFLPRRGLSFDEQIDFSIRQGKLIRNLVLPARKLYHTPFMDSEWVRFLLNAPRPYSYGEILYRAILATAYPEWFNLPTKTHFGLALTASKSSIWLRKFSYRAKLAVWRQLPVFRNPSWKWINYVDFAGALRTRRDFREIVGDGITALRKRKVVDWVDFDGLWKKHQSGKEDHAYALMGLASAEVYLKADKIRP